MPSYLICFQEFLKSLLSESPNPVEEEKLIEYTDTMVCRNEFNIAVYILSVFFYVVFFFQLQLFDSNKDGKLQLSEMAKYDLSSSL